MGSSTIPYWFVTDEYGSTTIAYYSDWYLDVVNFQFQVAFNVIALFFFFFVFFGILYLFKK